ncbi:J domain-containing protein [Hymenobacter daeguensis]
MTHYEILELPETATTADIRRAYRRLVLLTHPDRTPDPAAHARYLAINASYEILSDPSRRAAYDNGLQQPISFAPAPSPSGRARDAAHRAKRAAHVRYPAAPPAARYAAEYARALRLARPFLILSLALGLGLLIDLTLATEHLEKVTDAQIVFHSLRHEPNKNYSYWTAQGIFSVDEQVPIGTPVLIRRTPLRGTAVSARFSSRAAAISCSSMYDGPRNLFWTGLLLSALAGLVPWLTADQRLVASLANAVFLATTLLQLFQGVP